MQKKSVFVSECAVPSVQSDKAIQNASVRYKRLEKYSTLCVKIIVTKNYGQQIEAARWVATPQNFVHFFCLSHFIGEGSEKVCISRQRGRTLLNLSVLIEELKKIFRIFWYTGH
jgi:hypothetical protein